MRALQIFFRFVLQVQGAIVEGARIDREERAVVVRVRRHGNAIPCCCIHPEVHLTGELTEIRVRWRHLDIIKTLTYLEAYIYEGRCPICNGRRHEHVPWAEARARHTKIFDRHVASLAQVADKSAAARMFKIAWRTVGRMVRSVVDEFLPDDLLDKLEYIGVDETSYKRGHRYITVVTDHVRGVVVWIGKGKGANTLAEFFMKLGPDRAARLKLITMDMSGGYIKAVKEYAPQAEIVFDRFHVVKLLLDALDEVRKQEYWKLEGAERSDLKNTRFPLMRNPRHLRPSDHDVIARVKAGNNKLYRSYQLRVDFEQFWDIHDESKGRDFLMRWTKAALKSRLEPFRKFARTVRQRIDGILGFIRWPGSNNARAEGMNNKIKLCIHRAFGFHDEDAMIGMIQLCCSGIVLT